MQTLTEQSAHTSRARRLRPLLLRLSGRWRGLLRGTDTAASPSLVILELTCLSGAPSTTDLGAVIASTPDTAKVLLSGEPLSSPHFEDVLLAADRRGLNVAVETNGERLDEFAPVIYGLDAAAVTLCLHGPEDVHNAALDSASAFASAVRGAIALKSLSCGATRPRLSVEIPISPQNHSRLAETVECALGVSADSTILRHSRPGILADSSAAPLDLQVLAAQLQKIRDRWPNDSVRFAPNLVADEFPRYYSSPRGFGPSRCFIPWRAVTVSADSTFRLCPSAPLGPHSVKPLLDIFNSAPARAFRHSLHRSLPSSCATCALRFSSGE
jgi:MoaA/NifB/PqqE/SkfB family radical SAM enzyme